MADKNKLKKISAELKKASKMHAAQAEKIGDMSKGPSMMMPNITGSLKQNLKIQDIGQNLFEGQALADQMQLRRTDKPVMPPAPDPTAPLYKKERKKYPRKPNRHHEHLPKEKFNIGVNMNGDPKNRPYVVNKEKTGTSRDTLYLPKDTYVSKDGYAEDSDIDNAARKAAAQGIYNYTGGQRNFNFEYLEGSGKVKYKK